MPATIYTKAKVDALLSPPTPTQATLMTGWTNFDAGTYGNTRYSKDHSGLVHLVGFVQATGTSWEILTLPAGCRPSARTILPAVAADQFASIVINPAGVVACSGISFNNAKTWLAFAVTFRATQ